jgi:hypothetical protein
LWPDGRVLCVREAVTRPRPPHPVVLSPPPVRFYLRPLCMHVVVSLLKKKRMKQNVFVCA